MAREIDLSKGLKALSKSDLEYLRDRSRLTPEQEQEYLGGDKPSAPESVPLSETPNTGDTGTDADDGVGEDSEYVELEPDEYEDADNDRLREELAYRELALSGNKQQMIARLRKDDEG